MWGPSKLDAGALIFRLAAEERTLSWLRRTHFLPLYHVGLCNHTYLWLIILCLVSMTDKPCRISDPNLTPKHTLKILHLAQLHATPHLSNDFHLAMGF